MEPERWERIQALFHRALGYPEAERADFLLTLNEDPELVAEVNLMLSEDARPAELFNSGLGQLANAILHAGVEQQKFHPYRLLKLLGEGGMGVVYLAEHEELGTLAAVKVLRDSWISPTRRERFQREQQTLAGLTHPNIARLYEAHVAVDETPWFAMEYVDGLSITRHCRQHALDTLARLGLFHSLCEAVQHAHERQLIHRDLKPSNVMVSVEGVVKLLDFGIAKQIDLSQSSSNDAQRWMTRSHASPEQLLGEPTGVFTDVYALGLILYELLADRLPFDPARRVPEVAPPEPPTAEADLALLCHTALQRAPQDRFSSVSHLLETLNRYRHQRGRAAGA